VRTLGNNYLILQIEYIFLIYIGIESGKLENRTLNFLVKKITEREHGDNG
jgi:hypothetical protein